jgi:hypothetical protein
VDAGPRDTALAMLHAGVTLSGIALQRFDDEVERERLLQGLEGSTRHYLALVEAAQAARERRSPYPRANGHAKNVTPDDAA